MRSNGTVELYSDHGTYFDQQSVSTGVTSKQGLSETHCVFFSLAAPPELPWPGNAFSEVWSKDAHRSEPLVNQDVGT